MKNPLTITAVTWLAFVVAVLWFTPHRFALDDAYIAMHSARVVLSGSDPIFHSSGLTGVTNPAYVALIAGLLLLHLPPIGALWFATALGAIAFMAGIWRLTDSIGLPYAKRLIVAGVTVSAGYVWWQLTNGLETGWAMAIMLWLLVCVKQQRVSSAALLVGLVPSLRPDLVPSAGLLFLAVLWHEPLWSRRLTAIGFAMVVALLFTIWLRIDTGHWIADTMRAKVLYFAEGCLPLSDKLRIAGRSLAAGLVFLLPLSLGLVALGWQRLGRVGLLAIGITLTAYVLWFPGGLGHNTFRYQTAIIVPWAVLGLSEWIAARGRLLTTIVAAVGIVAIPIGKFSSQADAADLQASAVAVDQFVPADAVLLIQDAGAVSEFAHRRAVDFVGLKTPLSIEDHARWTWPSCGRDRTHAIATIARRAGASYLLVTTPWNKIYKLTAGLTAEGLVLTPIWRQVPGTYGYQLYRIEVE